MLHIKLMDLFLDFFSIFCRSPWLTWSHKRCWDTTNMPSPSALSNFAKIDDAMPNVVRGPRNGYRYIRRPLLLNLLELYLRVPSDMVDSFDYTPSITAINCLSLSEWPGKNIDSNYQITQFFGFYSY